MSIVNDIYMQLGGNKFLFFTGCHDFYKREDKILGMTIPRNSSKANRLEVIYDAGLDLYTMRFFKHTNARLNKKTWKWTDAKDKDIKIVENVYCDQLREIFEDTTGMLIPMRIVINGHVFG